MKILNNYVQGKKAKVLEQNNCNIKILNYIELYQILLYKGNIFIYYKNKYIILLYLIFRGDIIYGDGRG